MNDIPTFAILLELLRRMESELYDSESTYDSVLTEMPKEDTMVMYFAIEEFILFYKELIEERRHMQG